MQDTTNVDSIVSQLKHWLTQEQPALKAAGVTEIVGEYSGSGDEGYFQGIYAMGGNYQVPENIEKLIEQLSDLVHEPGYENNDGGGGSIKLNVEQGTIVHSSYWNEMTTNDNADVTY
jgi:hypothetical protein